MFFHIKKILQSKRSKCTKYLQSCKYSFGISRVHTLTIISKDSFFLFLVVQQNQYQYYKSKENHFKTFQSQNETYGKSTLSFWMNIRLQVFANTHRKTCWSANFFSSISVKKFQKKRKEKNVL